MDNDNERWEPAHDITQFFPDDFWQVMNNQPVITPKITSMQSRKPNGNRKSLFTRRD